MNSGPTAKTAQSSTPEHYISISIPIPTLYTCTYVYIISKGTAYLYLIAESLSIYIYIHINLYYVSSPYLCLQLHFSRSIYTSISIGIYAYILSPSRIKFCMWFDCFNSSEWTGRWSSFASEARLHAASVTDLRPGKPPWNLTDGPEWTAVLFKGPTFRSHVSFPEPALM